MIVYRNQSREVVTAEFLAEFERKLARASTHEDIVDLLIHYGELESALLDETSPTRDEDTPLSVTLRVGAMMLGRAFASSVVDGGGKRWLSLIRPLASEIRHHALPDRVSITTPEGYAYYSLYPEMYFEAARRLLKDLGSQPFTVIGIRSIGTSLSSVVAAALEKSFVWSFTVRPRGHPFDRRIVLGSNLEKKIGDRIRSPFLIVDEGPGMSGTSMTSVARCLSWLGVEDKNIILLPSWDADPARFVSDAARAQWVRHRKYVCPFEDVVPEPGRVDLSAGKWRPFLLGGEDGWPAVQPQHERRKYVDMEAGKLSKFAGLGAYGRAKQLIAEDLQVLGFVPEKLDLAKGFLTSKFVPGSSMQVSDLNDTVLDRLSQYLRARRLMTVPVPTPFSEILKMVHVNCEELLGDPGPDLEPWRRQIEDAPACRVDGRMLPHEWLSTAQGLLKTDAVDHHADHFFPGCVDIGWDIAGACIEWELKRDARSWLIESMGDPDLEKRLPFYEVAYLAFRGGYASMAAGVLNGSADGRRFCNLAEDYKAQLGPALRALARISP